MFKCQPCDEEYADNRSFESHCLICHGFPSTQINSIVNCCQPNCGRQVYFVLYEMHQILHHHVNKIAARCPYCECSFTCSASEAKHLKYHDQGLKNCAECLGFLNQTEAWMEHCQKQHMGFKSQEDSYVAQLSTNSQQMICQICNPCQSFSGADRLTQHSQIVHGCTSIVDITQRTPCMFCAKPVYPLALGFHIFNYHAEFSHLLSKPCKYCATKFISDATSEGSEKLEQHEANHRTGAKSCAVCRTFILPEYFAKKWLPHAIQVHTKRSSKSGPSRPIAMFADMEPQPQQPPEPRKPSAVSGASGLSEVSAVSAQPSTQQARDEDEIMITSTPFMNVRHHKGKKRPSLKVTNSKSLSNKGRRMSREQERKPSH